MTHARTKLRRAHRISIAVLAAQVLGVAVAGLSAPASAFAAGAPSFAPASTGPTDGPLTATGSGAGASAPEISVSQTSLDFGSVQVGSTSKPQRLIVTNQSAGAPVSVTAASATGPFAVSNVSGCDAIAAGDSCGVDVTFTPTHNGTATGTLTIVTDVAGSQTVQLSGAGVSVENAAAAGLKVAPTALAFGAVAVGERAAGKPVTITNTGDAADQVTTISATEPFGAAGSACLTKTLPPGGTCTVRVTFAPTAGGAASGTLRIATRNGGSATVPLSGTGATSAFSVTPRALSFGRVPVGERSAAKTETVRSTGTLGVTVESVSDARFTVDAAACTGHTLAPGRSCAVSVSFAPLAAGPVRDTLVITTSAGRFTVSLSGTGTVARRVPGGPTGPQPGVDQPGGDQPGGNPPGDRQPGLSQTGALSGQALVAGLALLVAGVILQLAGARRRRATAVARPPDDAGGTRR